MKHRRLWFALPLVLLAAAGISRLAPRPAAPATTPAAPPAVAPPAAAPSAAALPSPAPAPSPAAEAVCRRFPSRPPSALLCRIAPADAPALIARYRAASSLADRRGPAWALGYAGGEAAVAVLREALEHGHAGERLEFDDETILFEHLLALGFAADRSDEAYALLCAGIEPEFWRRTRGWTSERGEFGFRMPVYFCLQGLGLSGRADAEIRLAACRARDEDWLYDYGSSVAQGMFHLDTIRTRGREALRANYEMGCDRSLWLEWRDGPGKAWVEWAHATRRGPRPRGEER